MISRRLSEFISHVAFKRLRDVEVRASVSNQHEFNGVTVLRQMLGDERRVLRNVPIIGLDLSDDSPIVVEVDLSWYDARENQTHRAAEFRLYYRKNEVVEKALPGDLMVVVQSVSGQVLMVVARKDSESDNRLRWLFGAHESGDRFEIRDLRTSTFEVGYVSGLILENLGIDPYADEPEDLLEEMLALFGNDMPGTREFSEYARSKAGPVDAVDDPDETLIRWMDTEERLFRLKEAHAVKRKLREGFGPRNDDVDEFIRYSLSVQNTRKSRAGHAFELHLERIFQLNRVRYVKGAVTENRSKPDFLFPGIVEYRDADYPSIGLRMLGVKTSAKDRWRQILSEAERIDRKHLATLEAGISRNQLAEMNDRSVVLVAPLSIHGTYDFTVVQGLSIKEFIREVG